LHGFDEKVLNDIDPSLFQQQQDETTYGDAHHHHNQESSIYSDDDTYGGRSTSSSGYAGYLPPPAASATYCPPASSAWKSEAPGPRSTTSTSFANIASHGFQTAFAVPTGTTNTSSSTAASMTSFTSTRKVDIPQDLWNAHENRDSFVFYIANPIERYHAVSASSSSSSSSTTTTATTTAARTPQRDNVIDLHFQSTKTFGVVLEAILPAKLERHLLQPQDYYPKGNSGSNSANGVWIVTGTGHHVGSKTHQKGGGALEQAVMEWLTEHGYDFLRGRDRNGQGGAVLVTSKRKRFI
jgi:hypothetical protein